MNVGPIATTCCPRVLRPVFDRIGAPLLGQRLARSAFWSVVGMMVAKGIALASTIVIARILGQAVFGQFGIVRSTITMLAMFATSGVVATAAKYVSEYRDIDPGMARKLLSLIDLVAIGLASVLALVMFFSASFLANNVLASEGLATALKIGAVVVFFQVLASAKKGGLVGYEAFRMLAWLNAITGLSSLVFVTFGAYLGGTPGALWGLAILAVVEFVSATIFLAYKMPPGVATQAVPLQRGVVLGTIWFSIPTFLSAVSALPPVWVSQTWLAGMPGGYAQVGLFHAANQWRTSVMSLPGAMCQQALPVLTNVSQNRWLFVKALSVFLGVAIVVSVGIGIPVVVFSSHIMGAYGEAFRGGKMLFVVLVLSGVPAAITPILSNAILSRGKSWPRLVFHLLWGLVFVVVAWLGIRSNLGGLSLAIAFLVSSVAHLIWLVCYLCYTEMSQARLVVE